LDLKYGMQIHLNFLCYDICGCNRGFAFVTFKTIEGAKRAMEDSNKSIEVSMSGLRICDIRALFA
jgi:hypothetical protein